MSFPLGEKRFAQNFDGKFRQLQQQELFMEMHTLLDNLELNKTIFRSDHASNYLVLKGILGKDKQHLLRQVNMALDNAIPLRKEWQRGL